MCACASALPFDLHTTATIYDSASDDLENPDQIRSLLKDLREARQAKSREGLRHIDHSDLSASGPCFVCTLVF